LKLDAPAAECAVARRCIILIDEILPDLQKMKRWRMLDEAQAAYFSNNKMPL
jgi:recombinational DNA repair ATPase RecF